MSEKIKLREIELELPEEVIQTLDKYGYDPQEAVAKHLEKKIRKNINLLKRDKCPKCGKPTKRTLTHGQVIAVNHGEKALEELGVCTCEKN